MISSRPHPATPAMEPEEVLFIADGYGAGDPV
jgi:hypothetical protein